MIGAGIASEPDTPCEANVTPVAAATTADTIGRKLLPLATGRSA